MVEIFLFALFPICSYDPLDLFVQPPAHWIAIQVRPLQVFHSLLLLSTSTLADSYVLDIHQYDVDKNINSYLRHQELLDSRYNTPIQLVVQSKTSLAPNPGWYMNITPEYPLHPHPYRKYSQDDVALSMLMSKWMTTIVVPSIGVLILQIYQLIEGFFKGRWWPKWVTCTTQPTLILS